MEVKTINIFLKIVQWFIQQAFKIFLTFNATSMILVVYLIKEGYYLPINKALPVKMEIPDVLSYVIYMLIPVLTTGIS
jgi:hypothetical protein